MREMADRIVPALGRLPEPQRQTLLLYYWQDYDQAQIAHCLGVGRAAVSMRLKRGRERLARQMETWR